MKERDCNKSKDYGPKPYVADIEQLTTENTNFRTAIWTGCHLQMTVMCIPACGEIGLEVHPDTDQFIRIERGKNRKMQGVSGFLPKPEGGRCGFYPRRNVAQCYQ